MKLTCLSKGRGYHVPPCHVLDLSGLRILLECPLDLSPLAAFSPPNLLPSRALIRALPRYKAPAPLRGRWDPSLLDLVLVSSPLAMLGLPFLARNPNFSAKIYATEAVARFGRLLMEELVAMHAEYVAFYGPEEEDEEEVPWWTRNEEIEGLREEVRRIVVGGEEEEEEGGGMGSWLPLYSAEELRECFKKVHSLRYGERCCYNGSLILKPFSSGLEMGTCNWTICCPGRSVTYLSSSILRSSHAASFGYQDIQGNDIIIFSDFSSLYTMEESAQNESDDTHTHSNSPLTRDTCSNNAEFIDKLVGSEYSVEQEKINFICTSIVDSIKEGGSVLIPIGRPGIILQLVERISQSLELSGLKVPMYMISSAAEETLAFASAMPEWVSRERQEKLYSGEPLFGHSKLIEEKRLHVFPTLHSPSLISKWCEPCIVFSPHWSLRLGPSIHLLHRWSGHKNCLLILEQGVNADVILSPFKPLNLKVLQCSFLSGIMLHKILPLLKALHPKLVLLPSNFHRVIPSAEAASFSFLFYTQDSTLSVPRVNDDSEALLSTNLVFQLRPKRTLEENVAIARLQGQLHLSNTNFVVLPSQEPAEGSRKRIVHWGSVDQDRLLVALQEKGINTSFHKDDTADPDAQYSVHIEGSKTAVVQVCKRETMITAADEALAARIYEALCSALNGI